MNDETRVNALAGSEGLEAYLRRRERELIQQTAALRGLLAPKEKELTDVRQAMNAIGLPPSYVDELRPFLDGDQDEPAYVYNSEEDTTALQALAESLTIKEMILRALNDHFHQGATPSELSEYMRTAYRRDIDRNSISPQLARLREEGLVQNTNALSGKWEIVLRGTITDAITETEKQNLNALASSPRSRRWYGNPPKKG
jgi:DNA-binding transcriptional ArsR family regulator